MRILIAEDDAAARSILEVALAQLGHEAVPVEDGADAMRIVQQPDRPPLAILDRMMPEVDALEVCRAIRRRAAGSYCYVILVTTKSQRQDMLQGFEAGADDYIVKPFDLMELKARLGAGIRIVELHAQLAAVQKELQHQALHDSLTGLRNHGGILEALDAELSRAHRLNTSLGLAMADLDHFKRINDTHGHLVGDEVLKEAAQRLRGALRGYDVVGRFGGEEFLVVMPGCEGECMRQQAERLRSAIADAPFQTEAGAIQLSISIGVASVPPALPPDRDSLLRSADTALYAAKANGRNRVEVAAAEPASAKG